MEKKIVVVSGGFDPLHIGHLKHFMDAKELGDELRVILNSDKFLKEKKGYVFMPYWQRKIMIENLSFVDEVVKCIDKDQTVTETLRQIKPDIFAKGGDRNIANIPKSERDICERLGIKVVSQVGGEKIQSSSQLVENIRKRIRVCDFIAMYLIVSLAIYLVIKFLSYLIV